MARANNTTSKANVDSTAVIITVDGKAYEFRPGDVTGKIARLVRHATGMSLSKAMQQLVDDADLDNLAVVMYAASLQAGSPESFEEIEESISYGSEVTVEQVEAEQGEA